MTGGVVDDNQANPTQAEQPPQSASAEQQRDDVDEVAGAQRADVYVPLRRPRCPQLIYELRDEAGDLYYFNSATGVSSWEPPEWVDNIDPVGRTVGTGEGRFSLIVVEC
jgi:hypothetical protein